MAVIRCCGTRAVARLLALTGLGAALLVAHSATASAASEISANVLSQRLKSGPLSLTGYRIDGDVDLGRRLLAYRFTCHDCSFGGDLRDAPGLVVEQTLDLRGSTVRGKVDLAGAVFKHDLLASGTTFEGIVDLRGAEVTGVADFSGATFKSLALFGTPRSADNPRTFDDEARFAQATFAQLTSFEGAVFTGPADFELARFEGEAIFAGGFSDDRTSFQRTAFSGLADFGQREFNGEANFKGVEFRSGADFGQAKFYAPADFRHARFGAAGSFLGAEFQADEDSEDAAENRFDRVRAQGALDFTLAWFTRPTNFAQTSAETFVFKDVQVDAVPDGLNFHDVTVGTLDMSVGAVSAVLTPEDRQRILGLIESSAKNRDDLSVANDAHYERQVLKSRGYTWPVRAADFALYRTFAGYFVRPWNPLTTLLVLAAILSLFRAMHCYLAGSASSGWGARARLLATRDFRVARRFGHGFFETLTSIIPRRGESGKPADPRDRPWAVEVIVYRVLLACALIGFANSNPTLRQMFDALL